jgi:GH25 family lysozyme M1 (1,4-beta-N-acetylmuramidase)
VSLLAADNIYFAGYSGKPFPSVSRQPRVELSTLWLDVEDEVPSIYYDPDPAVNQAFLQQLVDAMAEASIATGVYTTKTYWGTIMDNVEGYGQFPLWYPRYDGEDSLDFFEPFADFTKCTIKQTGGDVGYCAVSQVDSNYAETNVF